MKSKVLISRADNPSIVYPSEADGMGVSRVQFKGRSFYLGKFNTPESHATFALWKHILVNEGTPPVPKELKPLAIAFLHQRPAKTPMFAGWHFSLSILLGFLSLSFAVYEGTKVSSPDMPAVIDGHKLSEFEENYIRGIRRVASREKTPEERVKELTGILARTEGPRPLHRLSPEAIKRIKEKYPNAKHAVAKPLLPDLE